MSTTKVARFMMSASALALAIGGATAARAQSAPAAAYSVEDVVVTARKREESLQQVPVAVSTATQDQLDRQNVKEPTDLSRTVPSLTVANAAGAVNNASIAMRGQLSGDILLNVSQAVGMYIDGINLPHPIGSNGSFFDLERVEVLKGPQGTLYGRNTTGGAINVITRGADFEGFHGFGLAEVGNYDSVRVGGAVNIPLAQDMAALRLTALYWTREGYVESRVTGQKVGGDRDDLLLRGSLRLEPTDTLTVNLRGEWYRANREGAPTTARSYNGNVQTALEAANYTDFATYQPLTFAGLALGDLPALFTAIGAGAAAIAPCINDDFFKNCQGTRTYDDVETARAALDIGWDITDKVRLRSLTGYTWFENNRIFDLDGLPYQLLEVGAGVGGLQPDLGSAPTPFPTYPYNRPPDQTSHQFTQEFNLSGDAIDERLQWLVGAFYADDRGHGGQQFVAFPALQRAAFPGGVGGIVGAGFTPLSVTNKTWALYTQNDFKITDQLSLTVGGRYTEEKLGQDLAAFQYNTGTGTFICTAGPFAATPSSPAVPQDDRDDCGATSSAKFHGTSYLASLNWQLTPETLLYAKTARGFRGGSLQGRAADQPATEPEIATDYELGMKADFFDRRLRANVAAYLTDYKNKAEQVITLDGLGNPTTILRNAAKAQIRGVEAELTAQPTAELTLFARTSYTDAEYKDYPNALTPVSVPADPCTTCIDASGLPFSLPKWQSNIGFRYAFDVGPGALALMADYAWRTDAPITPLTRDPSMPLALQEEFFKGVGLLNARIDYRFDKQDLTVSLFATNLLDEHYQRASIGAANAGGVQNGLTQEPRYYGISIRKAFGGE